MDCDERGYGRHFIDDWALYSLQKIPRALMCGRPRVEPSFVSGVIDEMRRTPDAASIATMYWLEQRLGRKVGPSTSTNLYGILQIAREMQQRDSGERYLETYCNPDWVQRQIGDCGVYQQELANLL